MSLMVNLGRRDGWVTKREFIRMWIHDEYAWKSYAHYFAATLEDREQLADEHLYQVDPEFASSLGISPP